jgi:hypothetical protein
MDEPKARYVNCAVCGLYEKSAFGSICDICRDKVIPKKGKLGVLGKKVVEKAKDRKKKFRVT